jgi:hypothetical protein
MPAVDEEPITDGKAKDTDKGKGKQAQGGAALQCFDICRDRCALLKRTARSSSTVPPLTATTNSMPLTNTTPWGGGWWIHTVLFCEY